MRGRGWITNVWGRAGGCGKRRVVVVHGMLNVWEKCRGEGGQRGKGVGE